MVRQPDSLGFRFALVLALAMIVLAIMTWVAPPHDPESASAEPIPPTEVIYRPQYLHLH
jgi:hypothetical protein